MSGPWPEWLTPEYTALHTAVSNEIVKALEHCYASADADGSYWTTEGWVSCSASNILGLLKRNGNPPPIVSIGDTQHRLSVEDVQREWAPFDDEDEQTPCVACGGSGLAPDPPDSAVPP